MSESVVAAQRPEKSASTRLKIGLEKFFNLKTLRGFSTIVVFCVLWQLVVYYEVPYLMNLPRLLDVADNAMSNAASFDYWINWALSLMRIFIGFIAAQLVGIPLGLAMGISRSYKDFSFPIFEILRPIPPIAWIPVAILFWPTRELSIYFLVFIGAFYIQVINSMQGVSNISINLKWVAYSLGAKPQDIFWRILLPGSLPSIITGMTVGMGVAWNVLIAAEMIAAQGGLGRSTWESYTNHNIPYIVVGMASIGLAGSLCSVLLRWLGNRAMPWTKRF